jgi:hypothetical protein
MEAALLEREEGDGECVCGIEMRCDDCAVCLRHGKGHADNCALSEEGDG